MKRQTIRYALARTNREDWCTVRTATWNGHRLTTVAAVHRVSLCVDTEHHTR